MVLIFFHIMFMKCTFLFQNYDIYTYIYIYICVCVYLYALYVKSRTTRVYFFIYHITHTHFMMICSHHMIILLFLYMYHFIIVYCQFCMIQLLYDSSIYTLTTRIITCRILLSFCICILHKETIGYKVLNMIFHY